MKRKFFSICFFFVCFTCAFAEDVYPFEGNTYQYMYESESTDKYVFSFKDGKLLIQYDQDNPGIKLADSKESEFYPGYYYIEKIEDYKVSRQKDYIFIETKSDKYLVFCYKTEFCTLVNIKTGTHYIGRNISDIKSGFGIKSQYFPSIWSPDWTTVHESTFLIEKTKKGEVQYPARGYSNGRIDMPWVEGVKGYGIGEWVEMRVSGETSKFLVYNGFTYLEDTNYYYYNSRVKAIDVAVEDKIYSFTLDDTPQIQVLQLPMKVKDETVRFIIRDVYKGNKYDDTAISNISYLMGE